MDKIKEPEIKRVKIYVDGQNLFKSVEKCFGYKYPNYNLNLLAKEIISNYPDRRLIKIHFYTGIHRIDKNELWHNFWIKKIRYFKNIGIDVFIKKLKYYDNGIVREKGIDVRFARKGDIWRGIQARRKGRTCRQTAAFAG